MYVILNSDILYATYLIQHKLPASLQNLCKVCLEHNVTIVIPETTLLEFNYKQQAHAEREQLSLSKAYDHLVKYGINFDQRNPYELIRIPDLVQLIRETGITVEVVIPTETELREAHRRSCLHEPPLPADSHSNEMRDTIIWLIALRIARERGTAVLLSADRVHNADAGRDEAASAGLHRADSIEKGLELLEFESPSTELARKLLDPAWDSIVEAGLPLKLPLLVNSVRDSKFIQGIGDLKQAFFKIKGSTDDGRSFEAEVEVNSDDVRRLISLRAVKLDKNPLSDVDVEIEVPRTSEGYKNRLSALKEILGD